MTDNFVANLSRLTRCTRADRRRASMRDGGPLFRPPTIVIATAMAIGLVGFSSTTGAAQEPVNDAVVARVNGEPMLLDDLGLYLGSLHESASTTKRSVFDVNRLMFKAINDMLLAQEARALGMDQEEPVATQVERYEEMLALETLERLEITQKAVTNVDEVRRFFEDQYREITLRVVTAYEREQADEMLSKIRAGADMDTLAREDSVDPYGPRGGLVKSVPRIDLQPEIAELALGLEPGKLGGPVRTDIGWSVLRLEKIKKADPELFPNLEGYLNTVVRTRKAEELRSVFAESLRDRHAVTINDEIVGSFRPERLPDGRLAPRVDDPDAVVARVGEKQVVTAGEYSKALLGRWANVRNEEAAADAAPGVLEGLIQHQFLLAEALARGYAERPEIQRKVSAYETSLLVPLYLEEFVAPDVEVSRDEMAAYFEQHREEYRKPPRIHLGQITVATEEEAERIALLLRQGTDLAWLARKHSIDRFKDSGGDRGWIEARPGGGSEHLLEAAAGDILDPLGTPGNFVVLKILARVEQGLYNYTEVSGNVRKAVFSQKLRDAIEKFMDTLRSRSEIEIDEEVLKSLRITGEEKTPHPHPKSEARGLGSGKVFQGWSEICE